jgi:histone H3/H4
MAKEVDVLVVVSKVKQAVKDAEMRSGDDFIDAVNQQVHMIIQAAINRARASGRSTLKGEDI